MIIIPSNRKWSQYNSGEVFGILHATKNINFDKEGYAQLARRPTALIYGGTNFGHPISISYFKNAGTTGYYCITDDRPMRISLASGTATSLYDATYAPGGLTNNDGLVWQGRWYITQSTSFSYHTGSAWNPATLGSLSSGVPHPLCIWESENSLAIGNGNTVKLYDTTHTLVQTLTLPSNFEVRWMKYNNQKLYIGTKNTTGGNAVMFVWSDTTVTSASDAWPVPANWMWSGVVHQSSIVTTISNGQVLRFNGGGWDMLAAFPVYYSNYSWFQGAGYTNGRMEQRGMVSDGHLIYLVIDGYVGDDNVYLDNQPCGLWVLDPSVGLYHKAGASNDKYNAISIDSSATNTSTETFTTTGAATYTALTGTKVWYKATGSATAGLKAFHYYYLIRVSSSTFRLASSYANAIAGTPINITAAGSVESLHCCDELDAGGSLMTSYQPGAACLVSELDIQTTASANGFGYMSGSQILFGAYVPKSDSSGTLTYTVQSITTAYNRGYIISQKIFSPNFIEGWTRLVAACNRLFQTSDKILIKYRIKDKAYYPIMATIGGTDLGTFTTGTTFTTTTDLTGVSVGEEVEFIAGRGAGLDAHITALSLNTGTWTVTIDETIPGVSNNDRCGFAIQNWKKAGMADINTANSVFDNTVLDASRWIQIKIEFRGHSEPLAEELRITNKKER